MEGQHQESIRCYRCGTDIPEGAEHCVSCGTPVLRVRSTPGISWQPLPAPAPPAAATSPEKSVAVAVATAAPRLAYAGFWLRALAYAFDTIVLGLITAPILFFLLPNGAQLWEQFSKLPPNELFNMSTPAVRSAMVVALPVFLVVGWLYYALCESSSWQATPGKRLLGLTVTDRQGRRIGFGRASARFFGKLLSGQLFGLGYVIAGFTRRKQALHDFIASCLVVRRI